MPCRLQRGKYKHGLSFASKGQLMKRKKSYDKKRAFKVAGRSKLASLVSELSLCSDKEMTNK
jgi:hypothetical protein